MMRRVMLAMLVVVMWCGFGVSAASAGPDITAKKTEVYMIAWMIGVHDRATNTKVDKISILWHGWLDTVPIPGTRIPPRAGHPEWPEEIVAEWRFLPMRNEFSGNSNQGGRIPILVIMESAKGCCVGWDKTSRRDWT